MPGRGDSNKKGTSGQGGSNQSGQGFEQTGNREKANHGEQTGNRASESHGKSKTRIETDTQVLKNKKTN